MLYKIHFLKVNDIVFYKLLTLPTPMILDVIKILKNHVPTSSACGLTRPPHFTCKLGTLYIYFFNWISKMQQDLNKDPCKSPRVTK